MSTMNPITVLSKGRLLSLLNKHEIRRGAHVIVEDSGALYVDWHSEGKERIWCEHASAKPVFDVTATTGTVLIGTTEDGHTWLQWERSAFCTCAHCVDWFQFLLSRKNQGPDGASSRTESKSIILRDIEF